MKRLQRNLVAIGGSALIGGVLWSCVEAEAEPEGTTRPLTTPAPVAAPAPTGATTPAAATATATASAAPAAPSIAEVIAAIPEDPAPRRIIKQTHYFVSNEPRPEKFQGHAEDLGGIYIGVGAEQNYLFAGWSRPEVLILADFDQWVVDVHYIHGVLMREAKDPEAFVELWSRAQRPKAKRLLSESAKDAATRERILERFDVTRGGVFQKLLNQQVGYRGRRIETWLTDQAQYDHLAKLYRKGHARSVRGDFTGKRTLEGIAEAARTLKIPVRTIYLSNVEDYFHYSSGLGRNLLAQPVDDRSMLLRTLAVEGTKYRYIGQRMVDFRAWLDRPGIDHRLDIFSRTSIRRGSKGMYVGGPTEDE